MTFSDEQKTQLAAPLNRANVKTRDQGGRKLSYMEGWTIIDHANAIFGFDGWTRENMHVQCVVDQPREIGQQKDPGWGVTYICKMRVTVGGVMREGCGSGHGIDRDHGLAHESAIKEAETDAMKRAFMTFGNQFGVALYDKEQTNVVDERVAKRLEYLDGCKGTISEFTDRTKLLTWWNSDAQKTARRNYGLSDGEVEVLKATVIARADVLARGSISTGPG